MIELVVLGKDQEMLPRDLTGRGVKDCLELLRNEQSLVPAEVLTHLPMPANQTARRLRPLARRRDRTARPFLVAMRARKPWVRARLMVLGWKVRFMEGYLVGGLGPNGPVFKRPAILVKAWA